MIEQSLLSAGIALVSALIGGLAGYLGAQHAVGKQLQALENQELRALVFVRQREGGSQGPCQLSRFTGGRRLLACIRQMAIATQIEIGDLSDDDLTSVLRLAVADPQTGKPA